jgi:hypothetical protein
MALDFHKILDKKIKSRPGKRRLFLLYNGQPKTLTSNGYVPMLHDARYFFCSGVSVSILTFIEESFSLAMALSIASGTG